MINDFIQLSRFTKLNDIIKIINYSHDFKNSWACGRSFAKMYNFMDDEFTSNKINWIPFLFSLKDCNKMMFKKSIKSLIGTRIELEIPFPIQMYLSRVVFNIDICM